MLGGYSSKTQTAPTRVLSNPKHMPCFKPLSAISMVKNLSNANVDPEVIRRAYEYGCRTQAVPTPLL